MRKEKGEEERRGLGNNYVFERALEFNYNGSAIYFQVTADIRLHNVTQLNERNAEQFGASLSKLFSCCMCMCEYKQLASMYLCVWMKKDT